MNNNDIMWYVWQGMRLLQQERCDFLERTKNTPWNPTQRKIEQNQLAYIDKQLNFIDDPTKS